MSVSQSQCLIWTLNFKQKQHLSEPDIIHSELKGPMGNTRWPNEDKVLTIWCPHWVFSQQKENWAHTARLSALCALWKGYWRLQYGLCLEKYEVYAKYPEVLYSVSSISNLSNFNKLSNLSISDKNDQQWPDVFWGFHARQSCFYPQEEVASQVK